MNTPIRRVGNFAIAVAGLTFLLWVMSDSTALAKGGHRGGHGGGGRHTGGHHAMAHHASGHHGGAHHGGAHHVATHRAARRGGGAHHVAVHHAAGHRGVRQVATAHHVGSQLNVGRNAVINRNLAGVFRGANNTNSSGFGLGTIRAGYGFGAGYGYTGNGYWKRPGYGGPRGYGYEYSYPYSVYPCNNYQYGYVAPYNGTTEVVVNSTAHDAAARWLSVLGVDAQSIVDATGPAVQVVGVFNQSAAEHAGLVSGDVIHAANGNLTRSREALAHDIANTPPNGVLALNVRSLGAVSDHMVRVVLP
jgi:hypothetical protein